MTPAVGTVAFAGIAFGDAGLALHGEAFGIAAAMGIGFTDEAVADLNGAVAAIAFPVILAAGIDRIHRVVEDLVVIGLLSVGQAV